MDGDPSVDTACHCPLTCQQLSWGSDLPSLCTVSSSEGVTVEWVLGCSSGAQLLQGRTWLKEKVTRLKREQQER